MPELRKITDAVDADVQLAAAHASGLARRVWAIRNGIDPRSLWYWDRVRNRQAPSVAFVELVAEPSRPQAQPPASPAEGFRLHIADVSIDVPARFDAVALSRLIAVVRPC